MDEVGYPNLFIPRLVIVAAPGRKFPGQSVSSPHTYPPLCRGVLGEGWRPKKTHVIFGISIDGIPFVAGHFLKAPARFERRVGVAF